MNRKSGKITRLTVAFILVLILVLAISLVVDKASKNVKRYKEENLAVIKKIEQKKELILQSKVKLPQIEDVAGEEYSAQEDLSQRQEKAQEQKLPTIERLRDLPLEQIALEQQSLEEETVAVEEDLLEIEPNVEEMKALRDKGLIIF